MSSERLGCRKSQVGSKGELFAAEEPEILLPKRVGSLHSKEKENFQRPILACSATATHEIIGSVLKQLQMQHLGRHYRHHFVLRKIFW